MRRLLFIAVLASGASQAQVFPGNDHSYGLSASRDLRYIAFTSNASNLVPGDTNGQPDVFVADRQTGIVVRVSVDADGIQGNGPSAWPSISADGAFVAFDTGATNLAGGTGLVRKHRASGAVVRLAASGGYQPSYPSLSDDGSRVAYDFVGSVRFYDVATGVTSNVTPQGFFDDAHPVISGDGRFVFFASTRSTLVANDTNGATDIFRWTRSDGTIERVSLGAGNVQGNGESAPSGVPGFVGYSLSPRPFAVSANGDQIAFVSNATNLTAGDPRGGLFGRNITNGSMIKVASCAPCFGYEFHALDLSSTATHLTFLVRGPAFDGNTPMVPGYYVSSTVPVVLTRVGSNGPSRVVYDGPFGSAVSENGTTVALQSSDIMPSVDDRARFADVFAGAPTGTALALVSRGARGRAGDGHSRQPALSDGGTVVAFASDSANLVAGDVNAYRDVFVRDYAAGSTIIASAGPGGVAANGPSGEPSISGDGRVVAFRSEASNLVSGDTSGSDIFARVLATGALERISAGTPGANGPSALSLDGRYVAYSAGESLWLVDRQSGTRVLASPTRDGLPPSETCNFCETYPLSLSDDGRYLAFNARANNHAPGQANQAEDVFVFDRISGTVELISRGDGANGTEAAGQSVAPSISGDGRYVAWYASGPGGLVPGAPADTTIFLRDRVALTTRAVGAAPLPSNFRGTEPRPTVSRDGSIVAFVSISPKVVPGDSNRLADVFFWDRASSMTTRASLTSAWSQSDGSSYVYDLNEFGHPRFFAIALSRDASTLAYGSAATNLGLRDDNAADDIFLVRADSRAVARASDTGAAAGENDRSAPVATSDGRLAVMVSTDRTGALASGVAPRAKGLGNKWASIAAYDFGIGTEQQIDVSSTGVRADADSFYPSIAPGGGVAAFASNATNLGSALDGNGRPDLFVRDLSSDTTVSITTGADGDTGRSATIEIGNKWQTAFESSASNLPGAPSANAAQDVFVAREGVVENTFTITPISVALVGGTPNGPSSNPSLAPNGRYAAFASLATNLVASDANAASDIFVRDLTTSTTTQVSVSMVGGAPNGPSGQPAVVAPGPGDKWIAAFESDASNLASGDTNNDTDVFVRISDVVAPEKISNGLGGAPANGKSLNPSISADGRWVAFVSTASNLVPLDLNNAPDVFLYDRVTDVTTLVSRAGTQQANDFSLQPSVSLGPGGQPIVTWDSAADNLIAGDDDNALDVYRLDTSNGSLDSTSGVIFLDGFE